MLSFRMALRSVPRARAALRFVAFSGYDKKYNIDVLNDARLEALGGATRDGLLRKLEGEFQGERICATRRAEDKLREELSALGDLRDDVAAFNAKRRRILTLRAELVIQREASGRTTDTANGVEREFPVPVSMA